MAVKKVKFNEKILLQKLNCSKINSSFLSLIYTKLRKNVDKRTDFYTFFINLFFSRIESA